jgi:hypothetical protein
MAILAPIFLTALGLAIYFLFKSFFKYFDARMKRRIDGYQEPKQPDVRLKP